MPRARTRGPRRWPASTRSGCGSSSSPSSACLSALTGCLLAGFAGADQTVGDPYLFSSLTAVIVGGTTFMGARGDYTHTVVGALILTVLTTILVGKGYGQADQQIVFGVLILLVVAGYGRERRLRDRV